MHNIDFLAVENEEGDGGRSGDAIVLRFAEPRQPTPVIVVIDAGFTDTGAQVVDHIEKYYNTRHIDLIISTHPDTDHLNGIRTILEQCDVEELLIHQPWNHSPDAHLLGNYDRLEEICELAMTKNVLMSEPFTGLERFGGVLRILGPTERYYLEQLNEAMEEERSGKSAERLALSASGSRLWKRTYAVLERALSYLPMETLDDIDDTGPRNKTSVITLLDLDERRSIFTGDTGIEGLNQGIDAYELIHGPISLTQPSILQVPHHGSKHNLGPSILDRILGPKNAPFGTVQAAISSAKASEKHPSPKVTNALNRRNARVVATEGNSFGYSSPGHSHVDWTGTLTPIGPLNEDD